MLKRFVSFFNTPGTTLMHHKWVDIAV
jgi:hypothetical protein